MSSVNAEWSAPDPAGRSRRWPVFLVAVVGVVVVGFFLGRSLWPSLKPTPEFGSLATDPDP